MRTYGQFCPIARASEFLAERWTPIILRNLLLGCTTFTEIATRGVLTMFEDIRIRMEKINGYILEFRRYL